MDKTTHFPEEADMAFSFTVPEGTKVLSSRRGLVTLRADVHIDDASRDLTGAYRYTLGGEMYIAGAGTVVNVRHKEPVSADEVAEMCRHRDGLVWFVSEFNNA